MDWKSKEDRRKYMREYMREYLKDPVKSELHKERCRKYGARMRRMKRGVLWKSYTR